MPGEAQSWLLMLAVAISFGLQSCTEVEVGPGMDGKRISSLTIRDIGPKSVDEARIRNFIASKPGTECSTGRIDEDIKNLYESGLVTDVRFLAHPEGDTVGLVAEVTTRPPIGPGPSGFVGNTVFSDQKLAKATQLKPGQKATDERIHAACRNIEKLYQSYGHRDAKVTSRRAWDKNDPSEVHLVFFVHEGVASPP